MDATRQPDRTDGYIHLRLGKGVWLLLTVAEYRQALYRGKMARRAARRARHAAATQTRRDFDALAWIDTQTLKE